ncbi:DUF1003 domain-containing protein [Candidatus Woesearchaeota archaeon]|nr:DUF1003 domain-containing protein [Candidatus Woesearchaeota archaeon]
MENNEKKQNGVVVCNICQHKKGLNRVTPAELVREPIVKTIRKVHPDWEPLGYICNLDLRGFREQHIQDLLVTELGELDTLEKNVLESVKEHDIISENIEERFERKLSFGEKISDKVAEFGGSWKFIISFFAFLLVWVAVNTILLFKRPFDPYPYILLNLLLSTLAAIQAPVIMMSQNRQEDRDRLRSQHDYKVNLKAELEIRLLNEKVDHLLKHQWQRLLEIQQVQLEMLDAKHK